MAVAFISVLFARRPFLRRVSRRNAMAEALFRRPLPKAVVATAVVRLRC
jgi:hypothetical protein